jgi:hypothetical protein
LKGTYTLGGWCDFDEFDGAEIFTAKYEQMCTDLNSQRGGKCDWKLISTPEKPGIIIIPTFGE